MSQKTYIFCPQNIISTLKRASHWDQYKEKWIIGIHFPHFQIIYSASSLHWFFFLSALLWDCSLCWDRLSIDLFHPQIVRFHTMEYIRSIYSFLFVMSEFVKKRTMEKKSNISLGRTKIFSFSFPLCAEITFLGQIHQIQIKENVCIIWIFFF